MFVVLKKKYLSISGVLKDIIFGLLLKKPVVVSPLL